MGSGVALVSWRNQQSRLELSQQTMDMSRMVPILIIGAEDSPTQLATFEEAVQTLKFNEAALRSSAPQLPISIE